MSNDRRLVWSSDGGGSVRYCARCGQPESECRCRSASPSGSVPRDSFVRIARDRKQRAGKTVTTVTGVPGGPEEIAALAQTLRRLCSSGGTVKDGVIELQGDHRDMVEAKLQALGYKIKRVGG
jgi:translation initiation factor 1